MVNIVGVLFEAEYTNTAQINADATFHVPITDNQRYSHAPFNWLMITNSSSSRIKITLDGKKIFKLGSGGSLSIDAEAAIYFSHVKLKELSSANIAAEDIHISVKKFKVRP